MKKTILALVVFLVSLPSFAESVVFCNNFSETSGESPDPKLGVEIEASADGELGANIWLNEEIAAFTKYVSWESMDAESFLETPDGHEILGLSGVPVEDVESVEFYGIRTTAGEEDKNKATLMIFKDEELRTLGGFAQVGWMRFKCLELIEEDA